MKRAFSLHFAHSLAKEETVGSVNIWIKRIRPANLSAIFALDVIISTESWHKLFVSQLLYL